MFLNFCYQLKIVLYWHKTLEDNWKKNWQTIFILLIRITLSLCKRLCYKSVNIITFLTVNIITYELLSLNWQKNQLRKMFLFWHITLEGYWWTIGRQFSYYYLELLAYYIAYKMERNSKKIIRYSVLVNTNCKFYYTLG